MLLMTLLVAADASDDATDHQRTTIENWSIREQILTWSLAHQNANPQTVTDIKAYRHIPTMTNSHHGGFLSVMIMVGICQWQNPTIDEDDEELQLFNHLTQFNWSQVYSAINRSVWVNLGRKYVCSTQLTVLTFHKLSFDISEVIVTEVMCGPRAICPFFQTIAICNLTFATPKKSF